MFQNLAVLFQVGYLATMKHALTNVKIDPLDQVIYRNVISLTVGLVVALCTGTSFAIKKDMRCTLLWRSAIGVTGNTAMTFGIALVPLVY